MPTLALGLAAAGLWRRRSRLLGRADLVDADHVEAEVAQPVEDAEQLGLVADLDEQGGVAVPDRGGDIGEGARQ